jgi:hypothetical protein
MVGDSMGKLISFLSLLFLLSLALISSVRREVHASSNEVGKASKVISYLGSRYNDTWKLLSNSEDSGFYYGTWGAYSKLYFLYTDNLLAYHALKCFALYWAEKIEVGLDSYVYPRDTLGVGVLFGENIPNIQRGSVIHVIVNDTDGSVVAYDRFEGDVLSDWRGYADRVIYHALDCYQFGSKSEAFQTFSIAVKMFDGKGLYDNASVNAGWYANFKLGLLLYADWFMDYNMNCSDAVEAKLWSCQNNVTGGIHTATNMTTGEPFGSSNVETSALALLPYTLEPSDRGFNAVPNQGETGEGTLEMGLEFFFFLFCIVVIVIVVWGLTRLTKEKKGTVKHEPRYDRE